MWPFRRVRGQQHPGEDHQHQQHPAPVRIDPAMGDPVARQLHAALLRRDWPTARDLLSQATHPDDHAFYVGIAADVDGIQEWIGQWVQAEPRSTLPLLVQGAHAVHWAWQARGAAFATQTSEEQFREFWRRLRLAESCLDEVAARDRDDTTARAFLVTSARGRQVDRNEIRRRFHEVVDRHPGHLLAHQQMLQYLCAKWYGSHEECLEFARTAVTKAPGGSPLGLLVPGAHLEVWLGLPSGEDFEYLESAEVVADLNAAADHSVRHPAYRPRPGWPVAHNTFAMAFALAEDPGSAAEQFRVIGDQVTRWPWAYLGDGPIGAFERLRRTVGAAPS